MQITGYFVEYLIIGSVAVCWLLPVSLRLHLVIPGDRSVLLLLAPTLYVVGMVVDVAGHILTLRHRKRIRSAAQRKYCKRYGVDKVDHSTIDAFLLAKSPDLAKGAAARTSRARVARGTLTNAIIALGLAPFLLSGSVSGYAWLGVLFGGGLAVAALWRIWARWQKMVCRYEIKAVSLVSTQ